MSAKITVILGILILASAAGNVYLYQKTTSLENTISQLQATNEELKDDLANAQNNNNQSSSSIGSSSTITGNLPSFSGSLQQGNNKLANMTSQSITAVAVKAVPVSDGFFQTVRYQGTVMDITVDIRDGRGLVLVNTEIPTGVDFQTSARTAVKVAQSMTGADLSRKDVIFSIKAKGENSTASDLQAVDGPSAGAAMTVLLAAELGNNAELKQDVLMTGTINPDGTVGLVGGVPEKAVAAGQYGAKIFLVPSGQAVYNEQTCEKRQEGPFIYQTCRTEQKSLSEYTEKNYGMKVIEVKNIKDALAYFQSWINLPNTIKLRL
ncbi:putative archaeal serine protease [Candidatus Nitrososphaera gargensis Ga9.2]|uniref:Putative archaeal serine protease n=1 Tax=Nitrososphaera gargensis (strain Ga9.2) TaxID=1237085 RepID=K0IM02_NITGG|nr:S16 family serine protease [Candidatus Nitrososphaera gargensis]AFU57479.1 putative archaeal serine protease [Candidatus Nitrososphaera gargensis Ga9.2]